ncbi:MAG TPA: alpha/beta fold hydrolase [Planctomycetota bacterium]|nr:alpha/beta fold hydrolase [Planctomycetota bacterium]
MQPFTLELGDGQRIVGDLHSGGPPGYLFLHGLGSVRTGEKSNSLLAHASARGRGLLRIDLRGHGESTGELGRVAVSELIADTLRVLEHVALAWQGPTVVVGSSLGGLLGAYAAAARPDLVRGLALLAPALGYVGNLEHRLDPTGRMWTGDGRGFVVEPRVLADGRRLDERGLPARLAVPTLVVHGTADEVIPHRHSERFFAAVADPRKELWVVPGGDHRLNTVANEIWARLDRLLAE